MMQRNSFHEDLARDTPPEGSSNRGFGLTVGGICAAIGAVLWWLARPSAWGWVGAGAALILLALARPGWLAAPNRLWMKLGLLLFHVVNPLVMAVLYYLCIVPMGLAMRAFRKDPLRLRRDSAAKTYWQNRGHPHPLGRGMKDQF
jgi:hypothetical protein